MKTILWIAAGALAFGQANQATQKITQKTFDSPQAAAQDLIQAAASDNTAELNAIFGTQAKNVLTSGDAMQDKAERQEFAKIAQTKMELERDSMDRDRMILAVGNEDWPFPVPIVKKNGAWYFDTAMGQTVMRARRIGANELDAIEICAELASAQLQYAENNASHSYAVTFAALGSLAPQDFETAETGASHKPYHGYIYEILKSQGPSAPGGAHAYTIKNTLMGGFAIAAWPAQYGVTGIHTFIVNHDGQVYEKDLGAHTGTPLTRYNPDTTWKPVN